MSYKRIKKSINEIKNKDRKMYKSNDKVFVRKRKMEFTDFVWYLIMQKGRTTSMEIELIL